MKKKKKKCDMRILELHEANDRILALLSACNALLDELGYCTDIGPEQRKAAALIRQMDLSFDFLVRRNGRKDGAS